MSKEFKVGIVTVIAVGLLYYGFNFLRGNNIFSSSHQYYVKYANVAGLSVSNPVLYNGLKVGRVSKFELLQDKGIIVVTLNIKDEVILRKDAIASLANDGLFGGKSIVLNIGKAPETLEYGDTLNSSITAGMLDQFEPVADNMNTTIKKMNEVLSKLAETDIAGLVDTLKYSVSHTTGKINRKIDNMKMVALVDNANSLVNSTKTRVSKLDGLIASSKSLVDSLSKVEIGTTVQKLNKTLSNLEALTASMKSDKGTLGKLMNDDSAYQQLNKLLIDLDKLAIHLNEYPKDFFGPLGRKHRRQRGLETSQQ